MNGKALLSGVELEELESEKLLDVIHVLFEEDLFYVNAEQAKARSLVRENMYRLMYNKEYEYKVQTQESGTTASTYANGEPNFSDIKPYVPPTDFDSDSPLPFGSKIDSPLM